MKLLTHNFLACISCGQGELLLRASKTEERKATQKEAFLMNIIERIDYQRLVRAWHMLGFSMEDIPQEIPEELSDDFLTILHHMLVEVCSLFSSHSPRSFIQTFTLHRTKFLTCNLLLHVSSHLHFTPTISFVRWLSWKV
jgi:hypothetical protein